MQRATACIVPTCFRAAALKAGGDTLLSEDLRDKQGIEGRLTIRSALPWAAHDPRRSALAHSALAGTRRCLSLHPQSPSAPWRTHDRNPKDNEGYLIAIW